VAHEIRHYIQYKEQLNDGGPSGYIVDKDAEHAPYGYQPVEIEARIEQLIKFLSEWFEMSVRAGGEVTHEQFLDVMQKCEPFVGIFLEKYSKTSEIAVIMRERIKHGGECMPIFWDMDIIAKRT
jgi:hypothetical protein